MSSIFSTHISLTTDWLIKEFSQSEYQDCTLEAWVFADKTHRQEAEVSLQKLGIQAKIRSAYKPLIHFFVEDLPFPKSDIKSIKVTYPIHDAAPEKRFLLEAYPLSALMEKQEIEFIGSEKHQDHYEVVLILTSGESHVVNVFAPNHLHSTLINEQHLSPTGWIKITHPSQGVCKNEQLITDYEQLFHQTLNAISQHSWQEKEPYFEELKITVHLPYQDQDLPYEHESISLREALHEDLYFSILEWFKVKSGYLAHGREGQIGHIVPDVLYTEDEHASVQVELQTYQQQNSTGFQSLEYAKKAISQEQIETELNKLEGESFFTQTITGRQVHGRYHTGSDHPVMISSGQHANETSGVVGALKAVRVLSQKKRSHFSISPLENPDGYELHQRLIQNNPKHMHHAARYTALGDDLENRKHEPFYEKSIRQQAKQRSQACLHINLHGYPSHEWTRPLSGYVPHGFDMWTIPKGFFLILRHNGEDEWLSYTEKFLQFVTARLSQVSGLVSFNQKQIDLYTQYAGEVNFRFINGIPCLINQVQNPDVPVQLITEFPDETLYEDAFIFAHQAQTATVLAAYEAHQLFA
ncbi:peptidase M14 [Marinomonas sp. 2405UD66-6]|uniref:peptidase M14 n=1 Tax=Marinomonas sp. 2405UD66-6 TaxID=3391834 RepID=UPI0039C8EE85